ncbi:MAG: MFS transporter [Verrucomicrobia bacterium]|jgi:MFS family permease|nr:MFS transporter [Verrucomicrobiota bacterium]
MTTTAPSALRNFVTSFTDILKCPRALWFVIGAFVVDSAAYFGVLTLMTTYLSTDLGWGDKWAGVTVSVFTMLITLLMLGLGSIAEGFGLRRAIIAALVLTVVGRLLYCLAPGLAGAPLVTVAVIVSLMVIASGEAILQPVCYSGIKQYTDEKTSSMGYGLIYAVMNLGIVGIATLSSWIRPAVQELKDGKATEQAGSLVSWLARFSGTGVQAVNWVCLGVTVLTLLVFLAFFTRKTEAAKVRPDTAEALRQTNTAPLSVRLKRYFTEGPFSNTRFIFFIFMLLPVRTLFAHQWLTMPQYIMRAYNKDVADHMEWLVNWINPGIIFFGVPLAVALTRHINVYKMMVIGTLVSALPTFLLCGGPNLTRLITYFVIFSIGEALWSARFLEYASELAPPGRVAQYMGLANIPWLLAKGTTGFYSGWMLANYCPDKTPPAELRTGTMWLIYSFVALSSPLGLWLARKWVMAGFHHKPATQLA